uniref:F-box domain-containing protein n=1 Tax=Gongylonema pulchrum TaxID=637853 RepID=A0A183EPY5_9BILA
LLAVSVEDSNMPVRLWAVDELSPRKQLVEFRLLLKSRKGFEKWVIASEDSDEEADDIYGSARVASEAMSQQVSGSYHDETDVTMVKNSNGRRHRHVLNLKTPLLELRSWKRRDRRCQILARGEKELYLCDTDEGVAWTLFTDPVLSLSVVPHMDDEIVFLDAANQIWYGKVGENFNRVKCGHAIETFSLYRHSNSSHWSSLAAIRRLKEPRDMATFYREHPKYEVKISREAERRLFGKGPTRAICCLNTDGIRSKYRSYLFRMMDDGSLWYEAVSVEDDQEMQEKMLWRQAKELKLMLHKRSSYEQRLVYKTVFFNTLLHFSK